MERQLRHLVEKQKIRSRGITPKDTIAPWTRSAF